MPTTRLRWVASAIASLMLISVITIGGTSSTRPDQIAAATQLDMAPRTFAPKASRSVPFGLRLGSTSTSSSSSTSSTSSTSTTAVPPTTVQVRETPSSPTTVRTRAPVTTAKKAPQTSTTVQEEPAAAVSSDDGEYVSPIPRNSTEACIVRREHGGSWSEGSNPTHKGRYQFARGTWVAHGGVGAHWDNWALTSPKEQDEVFIETVRVNGYRDWTPYNGC